MSETVSTEPYKGVRDFYPEDWAKVTHLFTVLRRVLTLHGYEEYQASPLERAELYERKTSEEIVSDQTYTFTDRGDRRVTLRPEMTPTLARMVAARRRELPFPIRWFSIPNVFRYERPQRGRLREHYQLNVDLLGLSGEQADKEVLVLSAKLLEAFGASANDFVIRVSSRTLLNTAAVSLGLSEDQTATYFALLDRKNKMTPESFEQERAMYRRNGTDPLELIEAGTSPEVALEKEKLDSLLASCAQAGITNIVFDPSVVRGFLYYTGVVFEVFDTNPENSRSLFGGGRYDGLVSMFGGDPIPAIGFGMGDVTLLDFLTTHNLLPRDITAAPTLFIGTPSPEDVPSAELYATYLRSSGIPTIVHTGAKGLGDQIKEAVRRGIPYFIAYGADEAAKNAVVLKSLEASTQQELPAEQVAITLLGA